MNRCDSSPNPSREDVYRLANAALCGEISETERRQLECLVADSPAARRWYLEFICDACNTRARAQTSPEAAAPMIVVGGGDCPDLRRHRGAAVVDENGIVPFDAVSFDIDAGTDMGADPGLASSPVVSLLGSAMHGTVSYFSQIGPLSYLIATFIMLAMGVVAWNWKLPNHTQFARQTVPLHSPLSPLPLSSPFVGRITGMIDCDFSDESTMTFAGSNVPLGRKYALASGLMEITYDTGTRVILQGPCTYEAESATGGYLSVGKVTARVEKKEERRTKNEELSGSNSSLLIPHSYFAVRTPTATVTDLGTEFGVEVDESGTTSSHVFQGEVRVAVGSRQGDAGQTRTLQAGQSARIDGKNAIVLDNMQAESVKRFVRVLHASATLAPADVAASANLVLWLKADAIKNVKDGVPVGVWPDSSGRRNHMYHATATLPAYVAGPSSGLNKMPVVRFDGTQQFCGVLDVDSHTRGNQPLSTPFTLFSVARNTDDSGSPVVRGYFGGGDLRMAFGMSRHPSFGPTNSFWAWAPNALCTLGQADSLNTNWNIHAYTIDGSTKPNWQWYCNGTAMAGSGVASESPQPYGETVFVGSSGNEDEYWVGDVAEILVYSRVLTGLELNQVGSRLAGQYGIATTWVDPAQAKNAENTRNTTQREELPVNAE